MRDGDGRDPEPVEGREAVRSGGAPGYRVHVIIPALDEERSLPLVLDALARVDDLDVLVIDNGSRDRTVAVARASGATVIVEPRRGYGAACLAGLVALAVAPAEDIVVFLDADGSDDPRLLPQLVRPLAEGRVDMVLASRTLVKGEAGALTAAQRLGNWLACALVAWFWGIRYSDLAPCRALKLGVLRSLQMSAPGYGWTVEMQVRAARRGLRVEEIPSRYRRRRTGRSKISGTVIGSAVAGATILGVIGRELFAGKG